ncbi:MAG: flagellar protein FlgN [Planctomycetota bacterium]
MADDLIRLVPQLETVLKQLTERHEQLLSLMQRQREALRSADHRGVSELSRLENALVSAVSDLEKRRLGLVAELTGVVDPAAQQPMRMRDLADRLDEPARGRLLVLREQLRLRIQQVKDESSVSRRATEALMKHMQGLVQTLSSAGRGSAYAPRTVSASRPPAPALRTLNLTA